MTMMGPGMFRPHNGIWMLSHYFFWTLILVGVILLIVWVVRQSGRVEHGRGEDSALDLLKKRYVRGEISREDFEKMKKDIS